MSFWQFLRSAKKCKHHWKKFSFEIIWVACDSKHISELGLASKPTCYALYYPVSLLECRLKESSFPFDKLTEIGGGAVFVVWCKIIKLKVETATIYIAPTKARLLACCCSCDYTLHVAAECKINALDIAISWLSSEWSVDTFTPVKVKSREEKGVNQRRDILVSIVNGNSWSFEMTKSVGWLLRVRFGSKNSSSPRWFIFIRGKRSHDFRWI